MALPPAYSKVLDEDHVRVLEDAIPWAIDHAFQDLAAIEHAFQADEEIDWDVLALLHGLPAQYRHLYTPLLATQFVVCLIVATNKMSNAEDIGEGMFSCVAEELAAHLVIREAEGLLFALRRERGSSEIQTDFPDLYELLFEDIDFEWLYEHDTDGIERDNAAVQFLGIAYLEFGRWFEPFADRSVHPYVEYRG